MSQPSDEARHGKAATAPKPDDRPETIMASSSPFPSLNSSSETSPEPEKPSPVISNTSAASIAPRQENTEKNAAPGSSVPGPVAASPSSSQTHIAEPSSNPPGFSAATDGMTDRIFKSKSKVPVAAIFIHAGAGFHSTTNEHVHLDVCREAAHLAMQFLKAGGTAVDAVEAAIKSLEDKDITNCGFGSNLSIDGIVENDATIVDHLGRSGACAAVPLVKNPISLARLILEKSNIPLTLRRIPPNVLAGLGAKRFAEEHGMRLVPNEALVSDASRSRFFRWRDDLARAHAAAVIKARNAAAVAAANAPIATVTSLGKKKDLTLPIRPGSGKAWERQTFSQREIKWSNKGSAAAAPNLASASTTKQGPVPSSSIPPRSNSTPQQQQAPHLSVSTTTPRQYVSLSGIHARAVIGAARPPNASSTVPASFWPPRTSTPHPKRLRLSDYSTGSKHEDVDRRSRRESSGDGSHVDLPFDDILSVIEPMSGTLNDTLEEDPTAENIFAEAGLYGDDTDLIVDTIGAIAIDLKGNIAAGSSSGGIGMKHAGRIGPAALVGVGTAVMPVDPKDASGTSVAAVTSGTGEHMATMMASRTCAERLYYNLRRTEGGSLEAEYDEDAVMKSFMIDDFMNHPGVRNQVSGGAIGVMAVKRTNKGIYFYFAHNTESFALASMASTDEDARVVMSRLGARNTVSRGARKIKSR